MAIWQKIFDFDNLAYRSNVQLMTVDEIYEDASDELLKKLKEDSRVERKRATEHAPVIAEYLSMWANTPPDGGLIAIGMADDGSLLGCSSLNQTRLNLLEKCGKTHCPDARLVMKRVRFLHDNGEPDFIYLVRVRYHETIVVETSASNAYVRRGDSKFKLSDDEKRELAQDKGQVSVEQEPSGLAYPDDFEMDSVKRFVANVRKAKSLPDNEPEHRILERRHLGKIIKGEFVPNLACALLFAKDPQSVVPGCAIRFLKYHGDTELTGADRNVVRDAMIEGRVPDLIIEADALIESQIRTIAPLGRDGLFHAHPEYPRDAWLEALVNACVHRSYSLKGMTIFVKMFDSRLVVESPGGFMPFVNPGNIYEKHERRNFFLMDAMYYLGMVRCEGEGVRRIRDEMVKHGLPDPEFEQKDIGSALVRVTLRNNIKLRSVWIDKDASDIVGAELFQSLDEKSRRVINWIAEHKRINVSDTMRLNAMRWHAARRLLNSLVKLDILDRKSKFPRDSNTHYVFRESKPTKSKST